MIACSGVDFLELDGELVPLGGLALEMSMVSNTMLVGVVERLVLGNAEIGLSNAVGMWRVGHARFMYEMKLVKSGEFLGDGDVFSWAELCFEAATSRRNLCNK